MDDIFLHQQLKFYFKYINDQLPEYFKTFNIIPVSMLHDYNTRNRSTIYREKTNFVGTANCLRYVITKTLNNIPTSISSKVNTHSKDGFATCIKKYFINKYTINCTIENCYVCNAH